LRSKHYANAIAVPVSHGATVPAAAPDLARWVIGTCRLLRPLLDLMRDYLICTEHSSTRNQTVVQVLKENSKCTRSFHNTMAAITQPAQGHGHSGVDSFAQHDVRHDAKINTQSR
jgi:hypothetical protein